MGLNHFMNRTEMTQYAAYKGVPAASLSVLASGAVLVLGGLGIILGVYPVVSAAAIAGFLVVSAITMHDFWTVDDPEDQQTEMVQFLKNAALTGGALFILSIGGTAWPYAVGLSI
jgi:uncharacterized membrane protein YphA (DoxX/SURF4 family)